MRVISGLAALALAAAVGACGSGNNSATAPSAQTLAGTWKASRAEYVSATNSSLRVEVVSRGTTMVLKLDSTGTFTFTTTDPGAAPEVTTGTWSNSQDMLSLRPTGMSFDIQFDMNFSGNSLSLAGGSVLFDINGDNHDEETKLSMSMTRV